MLEITANLFFRMLYLYYIDFEEMQTAMKRQNLFIGKIKRLW